MVTSFPRFSLMLLGMLIGTVLLAPTSLLPRGQAPGEGAVVQESERPATSPQALYGKLPLVFEENRGQGLEDSDFLARGQGYTAHLSAQQAVFEFRTPPSRAPQQVGPDQEETATGVHAVRMRLVNANPESSVEAEEPQAGVVNYLLGADSTAWRTGIPTFGKVRYSQVYPGIDLLYYGHEQHLEYDFVVEPGSDPGKISMQFEGADRLELDPDGSLCLEFAGRQARLLAPVVYQEIDDQRVPVDCHYSLDGNRATFALGPYDPTLTLVIDPILVYGVYLGGAGDDYGRAIAVDGDDCAYVVGETYSSNWTAVDGTPSATPNVFVAKLSSDGSQELYRTYFGGDGMDFGFGVAVDNQGAAYVAGRTNSSDFPVTDQSEPQGGADVFAVKLNPQGTDFVYSTLRGGDQNDIGRGIAVDATGAAYIAGSTASNDFPATNGTVQNTFAGGAEDAFALKLNPDGDLVYSTYLGGEASDIAYGIGVDSLGQAHVLGETLSSNFPSTNGAFQTTNSGGNGDAFVSKLNADGTELLYSTFLGGSGYDSGRGIALDGDGVAYLTGRTQSTNFPVTSDPLISALDGASDAFVAKLSPDGSALLASTYLGGANNDIGYGIAAGATGAAYVTGETFSSDFPATDGSQHQGSGSAFAVKLNSDLSALGFATVLSGGGSDQGQGIALDQNQAVYLAGATSSSDFPGASNSPGGNSNAFVAKLVQLGVDLQTTNSTLSRGPGTQAVYTVTVTNTGSVSDTFALSVNGGYQAVLSHNEVGPLDPGDSDQVTVTVTVPSNALAGAQDTQTVLASSDTDAAVTDTLDLTTTVQAVHGISLSPGSQSGSGAQGAQVGYSVTVTNLGNVDDTVLFDFNSVYPLDLSVDEMDLPAFGSAVLSVTVGVPAAANTGEFDTATLFATSTEDANLDAATASITTTVDNTVRAVDLSPSQASGSAAPGTAASYTITVTNGGNQAEAFQLSLSGQQFSSTVTPMVTQTLSPGQSTPVTVQVQIPEDAPAGSSDQVTLQARAQGDPSVSALAQITTTTLPVRGLSLSPGVAGGTVSPGQSIEYIFTVTNQGNIADSFAAEVAPGAYSYELAASSVGPLAPGESGQLVLRVQAPQGAPGQSDQATLKVTSQGEATRTASSTVTTTLGAFRDVGLSWSSAGGTAAPGDRVQYVLTLKNHGNVADSFQLMLVSGGFPSSASTLTVGPLAPEGQQNVTISVDVPLGAPAGSHDVLQVTAYSLNDNNASSQADITTQAKAVYRPRVSPTEEIRSGDAGETIEYTLTVTNDGNAPDTFALNLAGQAFPTTVTSRTPVGPLEAGASREVNVRVQLPNEALGGSKDSVTVNISSSTDPEKRTSAQLTSQVRAREGRADFLDVVRASGATIPGGRLFYQILVANTSGSRQAFTVTTEGNTFPVLLSATSLGPLMPEFRENLFVVVEVPEDAQVGSQDQVQISVTNSAGQTDTATLSSTVLAPPSGQFLLEIDGGGEAIRSGPPSANIRFPIRLTNLSSRAETFQVIAMAHPQPNRIGGARTTVSQVGPLGPNESAVFEAIVGVASFGTAPTVATVAAFAVGVPNSTVSLEVVALVEPDEDTSDISFDHTACFIATAAFGSPEDPQVRHLRAFRDRWLSSHPLGQRFVATYYRLSPPAADWIAERSWARSLVRVLLLPCTLLAYLTTAAHPFWLLLLVFGAGLLWRRRRMIFQLGPGRATSFEE